MSRGALDGGFARSVHAIVPTSALKLQWAIEFAEHGLKLEANYRTGSRLAHDLHGVAVTYQQLIERPDAFAAMFRGGLVISDEIHHAGLQSVWGQALARATEHAAHRLGLSGTPFRTDGDRIAHLNYDARGYVISDYTYTYAEAVRDRVVRPIVAYPASATVRWKSADGTVREASFEERTSVKHDAERLRAVLSHEGWVTQMVTRANAILDGLRKRSEPDAGGLAACMTAAHARFVADIFRKQLGIDPIVILSEDDDSDRRLAQARNGKAPWIIAVRKVLEGIDIKRLRVLAYLTNARAELIFRQLVGRVVRVRNGDNRPGYLLYPADPTLDALVRQLQDEVHSSAAGGSNLYMPASPSNIDEAVERELEVLEATFHALDPFAAIAATIDPDELFAPAPAEEEAAQEQSATIQVLERAQLRKILTALTRQVSHDFGLEMHDVYSHFARLRGNVDSATPEELQRRINSMRGWLDKGSHPVRRRTTRSKS